MADELSKKAAEVEEETAELQKKHRSSADELERELNEEQRYLDEQLSGPLKTLDDIAKK
jgi:hypothetical protein